MHNSRLAISIVVKGTCIIRFRSGVLPKHICILGSAVHLFSGESPNDLQFDFDRDERRYDVAQCVPYPCGYGHSDRGWTDEWSQSGGHH